tara:strand:+ start:2642 stop:3214 length:573 start_codon:yes stop_codon:yes gene_type:complete
MAKKVTKKKITKKKVTKKKPIKKKAAQKPASKKKVVKKTVKKAAKKVVKKAAKKSGNKTVANAASVNAFLKKAPAKYADDCQTLIKIMSEITKEPATMWGPSIIGFGSYHYVYESGREGDMPLVGFSPRASALSLYIISGFEDVPELMERLGKHKTGKGCLYIKSLDDVHLPTLKQLIRKSIREAKKRNK